MYFRHQEDLVDLAGILAENADPDPVQKKVLGLGAPLLISAYGASCALLPRTWALRTRPLEIVEWRGTRAVAFGCLLLSLAAVMHCHWFWSSHPRWHGFGQIGKIAALIGVIASVVWLLYAEFLANL
jgi:hypothetical protein